MSNDREIFNDIVIYFNKQKAFLKVSINLKIRKDQYKTF